MDELDVDILKLLQDDAKITNVALAESVNLSPAPCLRRVRELEQSGVIRSYTTLFRSSEIAV